MSNPSSEINTILEEICGSLSYNPPNEEVKQHIVYYLQLGLTQEEIIEALISAYQVRNPYLRELSERQTLSDDALFLTEE